MKKLIYCALALLFLLNNANAQEDRKIRFGLNAAPTMAWLKAQEPTTKGNGLGLRFKYGLVFDYRFADNFWFGTGLEITYLGGTVSYPGITTIKNDVFPDGATGTTSLLNKSKYTAQFLELPITVKMKTNEINSMVYFAQVGLNPGVRLDAKAKYSTSMGTQPKVSAKTDVALMRVAVNISGGVEYNLTGTTSLLLGVSYNNGFTNLFQKSSDVIKTINSTSGVVKDLSSNLRSNYIALNVGFLF